MTDAKAQALFDADGDRLHLRLRGEIDLAAQPLLDETYDELTSAEPLDLTVDLTEVTFLASNGLGFLARVRDHLESAGRTVTLHGPDHSALRALKLVGFDKFFTIT